MDLSQMTKTELNALIGAFRVSAGSPSLSMSNKEIVKQLMESDFTSSQLESLPNQLWSPDLAMALAKCGLAASVPGLFRSREIWITSAHHIPSDQPWLAHGHTRYLDNLPPFDSEWVEAICSCLRADFTSIRRLHNERCKHSKIITTLVTQNGDALKHVPIACRSEAICRLAIQHTRDGSVMRSVPTDLEKRLAPEAIKKTPLALLHLTADIINSELEDLAIAGIKTDHEFSSLMGFVPLTHKLLAMTDTPDRVRILAEKYPHQLQSILYEWAVEYPECRLYPIRGVDFKLHGA